MTTHTVFCGHHTEESYPSTRPTNRLYRRRFYECKLETIEEDDAEYADDDGQYFNGLGYVNVGAEDEDADECEYFAEEDGYVYVEPDGYLQELDEMDLDDFCGLPLCQVTLALLDKLGLRNCL